MKAEVGPNLEQRDIAEVVISEIVEHAPRPPHTLPTEGFVRLKDFVGKGRPVPLSTSSWWRGVAAGTFPPPIKLGRSSLWRVEDIRRLLQHIGREAQ